MKNRELKELKNDKNISPEDVANFALYDNDISDINKYTAICDLVVSCERSQTAPLKQKIAQLEKQNSELREALTNVMHPKLSKSADEAQEQWYDILIAAEQALNPKDNV